MIDDLSLNLALRNKAKEIADTNNYTLITDGESYKPKSD